jgi:hypothetical protein
MYNPKNGRVRDGKAQWIEIYNPTTSTIALKNWVLESGEGRVKIKSHKFIKPNQFVLISKDDDLYRDWRGSRDALNIEVGNWFDRGLDMRDYLQLLDPAGEEIDFVGWGGKYDWDLYASRGQSIERKTKGFDTDFDTDWKVRTTPTPGR